MSRRTITLEADDATEWGNDSYAIAYHGSTDATLQFSMDGGTTYRTAIDQDAADAVWTEAGHKVVILPARCHVKAVDGEIELHPFATAVWVR